MCLEVTFAFAQVTDAFSLGLSVHDAGKTIVSVDVFRSRLVLVGFLGSRFHRKWGTGATMVLAIVEALAQQVLQGHDPIGEAARCYRKRRVRATGKRKLEHVYEGS